MTRKRPPAPIHSVLFLTRTDAGAMRIETKGQTSIVQSAFHLAYLASTCAKGAVSELPAY